MLATFVRNDRTGRSYIHLPNVSLVFMPRAVGTALSSRLFDEALNLLGEVSNDEVTRYGPFATYYVMIDLVDPRIMSYLAQLAIRAELKREST